MLNSNIPLLFNYLSLITNNKVFEIILSAFSGGLFAGIFSYHYESKRRINDLRRDKYFEHRNTIVQIEQELIPARINISRNIESIRSALANTNDQQIQLVLRFYNLKFSTGLGLKLLNLVLINKYSDVFILFGSINSDIQYIDGVIKMIQSNVNSNIVDPSLLNTYITMLNHLKNIFDQVDIESLDLLSMCKIAVDANFKSKLKYYQKNGDELNYQFDKRLLSKENSKIIKQETKPYSKNEKHPQFVAPFMILRRV